MSGLPYLDLSTDEFWQDIYTPLAHAREQSKVVTTSDGGLYVLGHDEIEGVLKSPKFAAADLLGMMGLNEGPVWEWWNRLMFSNNDPLHGRIRGLVSRAFTPRRIENERGRIRELADALIDEAIESSETDLMTSVAHYLPSQAMAELFRIPEADRDMFCEWTTDVGLAFGAAGDPVIRAKVEAALANLDEYSSHLVEERRSSPGDDLLSELIAVEEAGDKLSTRELVDLVENLLFAGHDTTRGSIGASLYLLDQNPDAMVAIRNDPSLIPNTIEESLRYEAITFSTARTATEDVVIDGVTIEAGTPLGVCLPAASRDPRAYDSPDTFDIYRKDVRPPTFGAGAHYCIGASLARVELQEFLSSLVEKTSSVEVIETPRWAPFAHIRRYERFDVKFQGV
ncbi:MAG TPA: cytochrome P450 [Microthrixaceae bacterium]|nr:cytochrome P450 [Microthrixaceae bacterium]